VKKKSAAGRGGRYVALLRGINIGPHKRMKMKDLVAVFEKCGCTDVTTYIQSGNVVYTAPTLAKIDAELLAAKIEKAFGFEVPVVVRTAEELEAAIKRNPFPKADPDKERMHVSFLASEPTKEQIASLDPNRSPGDTFKVLGKEIYLLFPNGAGNTKLTSQYLDSRLKTIGTARNWRTVLALREMTQEK
jgi:uncharacterized protein (DUF1697 family)